MHETRLGPGSLGLQRWLATQDEADFRAVLMIIASELSVLSASSSGCGNFCNIHRGADCSAATMMAAMACGGP